MKKIFLLTAFLLIATSLQLFAVDGYWEQVFPKNPPPIRRHCYFIVAYVIVNS